ncbi:MAG: sugar phosphate nucleotidyltransferase [Patescibacteria group bacterium]
MNYAIILAGGVGSRFWPISTFNTPKQILNITGKYTPLQNTIKRIDGLINPNNILIITNKLLEKEIQNQVKSLKIPKENILVEPCRKNTALPIAWSAFKLYMKDLNSTMIVLPADHFIKDKHNFLFSIKKAIEFAQSGLLVTLGIKPSFPETAYGYIKTGQNIGQAYKVDRFIEKPDLDTAKLLVKDTRYFWNSGIFVWKTKIILQEFRKYLPDVYNVLNSTQHAKSFNSFWKKRKSISIDYGILEKSKKIILVPANFSWIDIGSWDALDKVIKSNRENNIIHAKTLNLNSRNLIIWSDDRIKTKKLIATIGVKDLIIVESKDAILICHKNNAQDVKKISQLINKE